MKDLLRIRVITAIWLIISVPVCITFFHYYPLSIADFPSSSLKIETPDELNLSPGLLDNKGKISMLNGFNILFSPELDNFIKFHTVSPQITSLNQATSILRC
jgi:hypothetical protein